MTEPFRDPTKLTFLDRLTQLHNWRFMAQYLQERFGWLASENIPLSVIMLDLDDFRTINQTYGRIAGDMVLKRVAQLLAEGRRQGEYAIRYAGDEFFVFLEGVEAARALAIAEAIRRRVTSELMAVPQAPSGTTIQASLGVATFPDEAQTASALIIKVRRALARSKRLGKNRVSRDTAEGLPTDTETLEPFHSPRLLGRDRELELCKTLFERAPSGRNLFILIEGEHGIGKSRFLAELPGLARSAGLRFIQGRCLVHNRAVPYSALTSWLGEYLDRSPDVVSAVTARHSGPTLAALGFLLPVLKPTEDGGGAIPAPEWRRLLFHGIADLLCLISESTPLVVFFENLQWADEASLAVLLYLLSRDNGKIVVCATAVTEELDEAESEVTGVSLPSFLPEFHASPQFHRATLSQLNLSQVGELAADILRHPIPARVQQLLWDVSQGVPLLVEETLKGLIARGTLRQEEGEWDFEPVTPADFPASPEEAIARRLATLDPEVLEVVSQASVIGPDLDLPVLAEVMGQDEGETLQIVDSGRRAGVFERIDPAADPGEIRFANGRLQEIAYERLNETHRRETHRKVAMVYERLASPGAYEVLGPQSYHFERSDDTGKAVGYLEMLHSLRERLFSWADISEAVPGPGWGVEAASVRVRVPEAFQPLDEHAFALAVQFVKALALTAKNTRLYPEGSQLVRNGMASVTASLLTLLEQVGTVTLAARQEALFLNSRLVEEKALAAVGRDLIRLFTEHGIRSVTFLRGMIESEVRQLLKVLSGPPHGIPPELARWEEFLSSSGIHHVAVFPALYLATTKGLASKPEEGERFLDPQAQRLAAEMLRSLMAAVDNIRLYPQENELNIALRERLERQAQALLDRIPVVTLALADDTIVINGALPNSRSFGITVALLHKLMQENDLTSLTLTQGVRRADLNVVLTQLAQPRQRDSRNPVLWWKLLADHGITTIKVGTRFYVQARGALTESGAPGAPVPAGALTEEDRLFQRVTQWLEDPTADPSRGQEEILSALDSWLGSEREERARQLWERIVPGLGGPMGRTRQRAAVLLYLFLKWGTSRTLPWLHGLSFEPLEEALLKELSPDAFQWEVRAAAEVLKLLLKEGDLSRSARWAEALGRGQRGKPDETKHLAVVAATVEALAGAGAFEPVLAALRGSDPTRREQGKAVLTALGEGALHFLVGLVAWEENEEIRKVVASLLRPLPGALPLLIPQLHPPTSREISRRIVSVLDILAPAPGPEFLLLLVHPDGHVREEFADIISRLSRDAALRFLRRALGEPDPEILSRALECVRKIRATELVDAVLHLVTRGTAPEVLRAAYRCLGDLKDERGVRPLVEILQSRRRFLVLGVGLPDGLRASAARALGELPFPEARQALREALEDPSPLVRSVARMVLSRVEQEREPQ